MYECMYQSKACNKKKNYIISSSDDKIPSEIDAMKTLDHSIPVWVQCSLVPSQLTIWRSAGKTNLAQLYVTFHCYRLVFIIVHIKTFWERVKLYDL